MPKKKKGGQSPPKMKGKGDYKTAAKKVAGAVASKQGGAIAAKIGRSIGSAIGSRIGMADGGGAVGSALALKAHTMIGKKLQKLIGRGDYSLEGSQTSVNSLIKGHPSAYSSFGDNHAETVVEYREYIGDLATGTVTPQVAGTLLGADVNLFYQTFNVNPGDPTVFPWFNKIATRYEEYKFDGLIFEYVSTTSPYNTNSAMGEVIITSQDNVTATELTTRQSMFNTEMCCTARLDRNIMYGVECKSQAQNWYYVKGNASAATPANLQDFVKVYFASQVAASFPSNSVLGEIWVTYRVRLRGPVMLDGTDTVISVSSDTTAKVGNMPPDLTIDIGKSNIYATGAYTTLSGSTTLAYTSPYDMNGNVAATSGYARAAQMNLTKIRTGEVMHVVLTFPVVYNTYFDPITFYPPSIMWPEGAFQLYSGNLSTNKTTSATTLPQCAVYVNTASTTVVNDLGMTFTWGYGNIITEGTLNYDGAHNPSYSYFVQFLSPSNIASKPITYGTGAVGAGQVGAVYPSSLFFGWATEQGTDVMNFPVAQNVVSGQKNYGLSQFQLTVKSMGVFDIAETTSDGATNIVTRATPSFTQNGTNLLSKVGAPSAVI